MLLQRQTNRIRRLFGIDLPAIRPVFLHIPKTAGASIRRVLTERHARCWSVSVSVTGDMAKVRAMPDWKFRRCAFYAGHFGLETVDRVRSEKFVFTFLREPLDRVLSHYYYFRRLPSDVSIEAAQLAKKLSLVDYMKCDHPGVRHTVEDVQARQLIEPEWALEGGLITAEPDAGKRAARAIEVLARFDFVGLTECFDQCLDRVSRGVGFSLKVYRENKTEDRPAISELSAIERDAVEEAIQADRIVYRWALDNWQGRSDRQTVK
jgi:hypothetical protein